MSDPQTWPQVVEAVAFFAVIAFIAWIGRRK
jgi:hypothetical protein